MRGPPDARLSAPTIARLEALRRVAMGAAHALNNAFTTLVGETAFLQEDRKADPLVAETCEVLLLELDRCTRLTRALLVRREPSQRGGDEVDLVRLVRELAALLQETLGRQNELEVELPDDLVPVAGTADELELIVLVLVHYAADGAEGATRLRLGVEADPGDGLARLWLEAQGAGLPADVEVPLLAPPQAPDPLTSLALEAVGLLVAERGGSVHAARTAPDAWTARITLPVAP